MARDSPAPAPIPAARTDWNFAPMAHASRPHPTPRPAPARPDQNLPEGVMIAIMLVALAILIVIAYLLWPRWPDAPRGAEPGKLPISVGGLLLNVPRAAIRVPVQRRSGAQERIDLAFTFPALTPPGPRPRMNAETASQSTGNIDRLFVSVQAHGGAMSPLERARAIYTRYFAGGPERLENGLIRQSFADTSPYRAEDWISAQNSDFVARCSRDETTPGMCLSERRIGGADLTFRFPRAWLSDWTKIAGAMETLIARLVVPAPARQ